MDRSTHRWTGGYKDRAAFQRRQTGPSLHTLRGTTGRRDGWSTRRHCRRGAATVVQECTKLLSCRWVARQPALGAWGSGCGVRGGDGRAGAADTRSIMPHPTPRLSPASQSLSRSVLTLRRSSSPPPPLLSVPPSLPAFQATERTTATHQDHDETKTPFLWPPSFAAAALAGRGGGLLAVGLRRLPRIKRSLHSRDRVRVQVATQGGGPVRARTVRVRGESAGRVRVAVLALDTGTRE